MSARILAAAVVFAATPAFAQHAHHGHAHGAQPASPYAGQQSRDIKALSEDEVRSLLAGAGMGYAKAAELNRYPGPMHALEHAESLALSASQRDSLEALMRSHKAEARALGERVVALERELDGVFAGGNATPHAVDRVLAQLGEATAGLRGSHLKTHVATRGILTPAQVERYVELRGYRN